MSERADSAADLSDRYGCAGFRQALAVTKRLVVPECEGQTKRSGLGVNAMRAPDLRRVLEFKRAALEHVEERIDLLYQDVAGIAQQQRVRRIDHVRRSQSVVNKARRVANRFRQIRSERDNIVIGGLFNLVDARHRKLRAV